MAETALPEVRDELLARLDVIKERQWVAHFPMYDGCSCLYQDRVGGKIKYGLTPKTFLWLCRRTGLSGPGPFNDSCATFDELRAKVLALLGMTDE